MTLLPVAVLTRRVSARSAQYRYSCSETLNNVKCRICNTPVHCSLYSSSCHTQIAMSSGTNINARTELERQWTKSSSSSQSAPAARVERRHTEDITFQRRRCHQRHLSIGLPVAERTYTDSDARCGAVRCGRLLARPSGSSNTSKVISVATPSPIRSVGTRARFGRSNRAPLRCRRFRPVRPVRRRRINGTRVAGYGELYNGFKIHRYRR